MKFTVSDSFPKVTAKLRIGELVITKEEFNEVQTHDGVFELRYGIKEPKEYSLHQVRKLIRAVTRQAEKLRLQHLVITMDELPFKQLKLNDQDWSELIVRAVLVAHYEFTQYKSKAKPRHLKSVTILASSDHHSGLKKGLKPAQVIAESINACRDLANATGMDMTPAALAKHAQKLTKGLSITAKVFDEKKLKQERMYAILAVGQGSVEPSRCIILEYWGAGKSKGKPTVLVGKGVTYDTGGLNVKPSGYMFEMNMDMSGGATVIATIMAAAKLKLKKNVVAIIPSAENAVSGSSYRPGDIIKTRSGQTVEVQHTDAEGRLLLADALDYAAQYKPKLVVDVATLTGASLVALGQRSCALFATDEKISQQMVAAGEQSGHRVWPLPLWPEFKSEMKGSFGDLTNIHNKRSRYGGVVTAAAFLWHFVKGYPWAHIDMAPRMTAIAGDHLAKGATGEPVALLIEMLRN